MQRAFIAGLSVEVAGGCCQGLLRTVRSENDGNDYCNFNDTNIKRSCVLHKVRIVNVSLFNLRKPCYAQKHTNSHIIARELLIEIATSKFSKMNSKHLKLIKNLIISSGLKKFVLYLLGLFAKIFRHHICKRNGINYSLDLNEAIDFATFFGGWEPETIEFIETNVKEGNYVIEVGANVGIQTLHLAKKVGANGRIFAFEPTQFALTKLNENCQLNPDLSSRISILKNLVTNGQHSAPIKTIRSSWQTGKIKNDDEFINADIAISIDEFVAEKKLIKLDLLKIDVDGYDFKVLQGATKAILKFKPLIYIELGEVALNSQGDSVSDIFKLFIELGYEGRIATNPNQSIDFDKTVNYLKTSTHLNAIFAPA